MKKAKLTLGLVLSLVSVVGLTACNEATYSDGVVLTYKDASGNKVSYTAEELFGEPRNAQLPRAHPHLIGLPHRLHRRLLRDEFRDRWL